jgi:hypothetical protein
MGTEARQRTNYGPRGKGNITILPVKELNNPDNWKEVKVTIFDEDGYKDVYHLTDIDGLTKQFGDWKLQPIKDVYVELDADEEDIRSVRPFEGTFTLSFDRFVARQDENGSMLAPTIKHKPAERITIKKTNASWMNPPHDRFFAILKIRANEIGKSTEFDGMEVLKTLVYQFERNPDTGMMEIVWERKFWYDELAGFLTLTGYDWDADNLTPSENVLGELQEILQDRDTIFRGTFSNGWLNRDLDNPAVGVTLD